MKRLVVVSALALVSLTACTSTDKADKTATDPKVADAALSQDTKAICDQADRTGTSFGSTLTADLKLQLDARSKGAAATAEAKQKLTQDVSNYSYALGDMSKLAGDATLKSTLKQMSDQVTAFSGDASKIDASKLSELSDTLDKACGKG
ncbi:hypothetical protein [Actinoplanes sp. NPDC051411]|uniref:hypothetical protein n=1 Tax=Actinoplanes sp. NPDC051411 TaxID=3155522 RepID=UPI00343D4C74